MNKIIVCTRCVMDTTDPNIKFNQNGVCDYCLNYDLNISKIIEQPEHSKIKKLDQLVKLIKQRSSKFNKKYDCLVGVSGGVDSSYLVYLLKKKYNLNPLLYHVDAGWNSSIAVSNIEKLVDKLNLDLHTEVVNWREMRDLQLSYFKAQVPSLDTPQDHVFFAGLYNFANKYNFKHILSGGNFSTECVREPLLWHYHATDLKQLKDIHAKYGTIKLNTIPLIDIFKYKFYLRFIKKIKIYQPLNYINYVKVNAINTLKKEIDWQEYEHKHYESRFTKFYESFWLVEKFGFDKRKAHYSSLILTNQMSRDKALQKLNKKAYSIEDIEKDKNFIAKKLSIKLYELEELFKGKNRYHFDYKSNYKIINFFTKILRILKIEKRIIR